MGDGMPENWGKGMEPAAAKSTGALSLYQEASIAIRMAPGTIRPIKAAKRTAKHMSMANSPWRFGDWSVRMGVRFMAPAWFFQASRQPDRRVARFPAGGSRCLQ